MKNNHHLKTNTLLVAVFLGIGLLGCKKDDPEKEGPCGVKDPTTELPWLKKEIERYQNLPGYATYVAAIGTTVYKGERIFWKYDFASSDGSTLYRCNGTFFYLPRAPKADEEGNQLREIMAVPNAQMCPYLVWQTPYFKKVICN